MAVLHSADRREDTAPGNGLHESEGPETSLLSSRRADRKFGEERQPRRGAITIYIPTQAGAGKLQVAGVETRTPVLPPQGREGNPTTVNPIPPMDSSLVAGPPVGPYLGYLEPEVQDNVCLMVARTVVPVENGCTVARLLNPTDQELKLHTGSHLGVFYRVNDCDLLTPKKVLDSEQVAASLPAVEDCPLSAVQRQQLEDLLGKHQEVFRPGRGRAESRRKLAPHWKGPYLIQQRMDRDDEVLGQRRLLGLGALVAWLVLFHLLVNVWLLCIFTSLLVVLGGWLGSRAALDANSLLHLEHFVPLGKAPPSSPLLPLLPSGEHERRLDCEIHTAVHKAMRDFVSSWYRALLPESLDGEFERQVHGTMLDSVMELKVRARRLDRKMLVQRALELCGSHLQSYMVARKAMEEEEVGEEGAVTSLWRRYSQASRAPHPALRSATAELSYARSLVTVVLHALVPYPHMESPTGGYMVSELITCNLLLPVVGRVSEPDWLNQTFVDVFDRVREPREHDGQAAEAGAEGLYGGSTTEQESWVTCCSLSSSSSNHTGPLGLSSGGTDNPDDEEEVPPGPAGLWDSSLGRAVSLIGVEGPCPPGLLPPCAACFLYPTESDRSSIESKMFLAESRSQSESEDDPEDNFCDCAPPTNFCNFAATDTLNRDEREAPGCFGPLRSLGPKLLVVAAAVPEQEDSHWPAGMAQEPLQPQPFSPPRGTALPHYNFEVPPHRGSSSVAHVSVHNVHITGTSTAKEQRGNSTHPYTLYMVKYETLVVDSESQAGPSQPSTTTSHAVTRRYSEFLNLQTRLEEKPELKKYIKNIKGPKKLFPDLPFGNADLDKAESRKGQLDTFLKMVVNALDTLKTAFPRCEPPSPSEELEGDPDGRTADNRKYRRLRFPSKIAPSLNIPDLEPKVTYCFSEGCSVLGGLSLAGLESFTQEQERLAQRGQWGAGQPPQQQQQQPPGRPQRPQDLRETTGNRWLDVGVARLTSAPCWVLYLQVLQEAVWPGGVLPAQPRPERSAAQRLHTKQQCLERLVQLLPEIITDMLGNDKYRLSLETILESLQDHQINKHLVYSICDLLVEFLIPEASDETFQKSLLNSPSNYAHTEKAGRPS
ncbi:LOW QUALITY PROTEIN: hypothetical protein CRUP_021436 [Coryphaenoides rupestris]|nr:LOW QUALITY PROTEIN: hypothetical protein CRUP_021436 [Coryphaenoides rupestris]